MVSTCTTHPSTRSTHWQDFLLCGRPYIKHLIEEFSYFIFTMILSPFCKWGQWNLAKLSDLSTKQWNWRSDEASATGCSGPQRCTVHCDQPKLFSLLPESPFLDFQPTLPPAAVPVTEVTAKSMFHPGFQISNLFSFFSTFKNCKKHSEGN